MSKKEINASRKFILRILVIALLTVVLLLVNSLTIWVCDVVNKDRWRHNAYYEQYADDFNLVKDYITAEYIDKSDNHILITVQRHNGEKIGLYDTVTQKHLSIPDDVLLSVDVIARNGFPYDASWAYIKFCDGNVLFGVDARGCALVYSPEGNTTWIDLFYKTPNVRRVRVKEIEDGWYHVVKAN